MSIPKAVVTRLAKQHPHSAAILQAFVPLLDAQNDLAEELPLPVLPVLDTVAFAEGKPWLPALTAEASVYLDDAFMGAAPKKLIAAAIKGFPDIKEDLRALGNYFAKNADGCFDLAALRLQGKTAKIKNWAKEKGLHADAALLLAQHLAGTAARRVDRATKNTVLPPWSRSYCPVCGSRPHGSYLKNKEGNRFLQCSLCRHEWSFSRTTCPVCEQNDPKELPIFFIEDKKYERAEGCNVCKHYLLGLDMRELSEDTPLELYLLCMMHLDILMGEKELVPVAAAG